MTDETTNETPKQERPEPISVAEYQAEVRWLRKELTDVRSEAADRRTKARELEDQIKGMKSSEDYTALQQQLAETQKAHAHQQLIQKYAGDLPESLRSRVSWPEDEDGIKTAAQELSQFAGGHVESTPSGGLGPRYDAQDNESYDPATLAAALPR